MQGISFTLLMVILIVYFLLFRDPIRGKIDLDLVLIG
jgi:hypothetical protein